MDLLAAALAERNRMTPNHYTYFPIFRSHQCSIDPKEGLEGIKWLSKAEKGIKWLSKAEIGIIKQIKPYEGGNDLLWSLHHLDVLRKHKRLIFVTVQRYILNAVVLGASDLGPVVSEVRRLENETVLLEIAAGAPQPQIQTTPR